MTGSSAAKPNSKAPPPSNPLANVMPEAKASRAPEFSVVICSPPSNKAKLERTLSIYQQTLAGEDYEIIVVDDARSIADGYLRGIERSRGRTLVFSHDDAAPLRPFAARLRQHLRKADIVGGAGSDRLDGPAWFTAGPPHVFGQVLNQVPIAQPGQPPFLLTVYGVPSALVEHVQAIDGFWMAANRDVLHPDAAWFDPELCDGFHMYDLDFSYRAYLRGVNVGVACDLGLLHASSGGYGDPKWKPAADKWMAQFGPSVADHKPFGFQFAGITGHDPHALLGIMDDLVERTR